MSTCTTLDMRRGGGRASTETTAPDDRSPSISLSAGKNGWRRATSTWPWPPATEDRRSRRRQLLSARDGSYVTGGLPRDWKVRRLSGAISVRRCYLFSSKISHVSFFIVCQTRQQSSADVRGSIRREPPPHLLITMPGRRPGVPTAVWAVGSTRLLGFFGGREQPRTFQEPL